MSERNFALTLSLRLKLDVALGLRVHRDISLGRRQKFHLPLVRNVKLDLPICTKLELRHRSSITFILLHLNNYSRKIKQYQYISTAGTLRFCKFCCLFSHLFLLHKVRHVLWMVSFDNGRQWSHLVTYLTFVWPCIIDINNKEDTQLDATITVYW
jgi:hypothetical protein